MLDVGGESMALVVVMVRLEEVMRALVALAAVTLSGMRELRMLCTVDFENARI